VAIVRVKTKNHMFFNFGVISTPYRGADKSLARPGRKEARKHFRDTRDSNKIKAQAVNKFLFLQGKVPKEIHAILTETLACFLPRQAKNLSAPLYNCICIHILTTLMMAHECPKHVCDYCVIKLHSYIQMHLLVFINILTCVFLFIYIVDPWIVHSRSLSQFNRVFWAELMKCTILLQSLVIKQ
jgi:hypothetical protein